MLENFKKFLQERVEKNSYKLPNIFWVDKDGRQYFEDVVIKKSQLPLVGDWARIYPAIDENGNINWMNVFFGGWKNFMKLVFIMFILGCVLIGYWEIFKQYESLQQTCIPLI